MSATEFQILASRGQELDHKPYFDCFMLYFIDLSHIYWRIKNLKFLGSS